MQASASLTVRRHSSTAIQQTQKAPDWLPGLTAARLQTAGGATVWLLYHHDAVMRYPAGAGSGSGS